MATLEPSIVVNTRCRRLLNAFEALLGEDTIDKTYVHEYESSPEGRVLVMTWIRYRVGTGSTMESAVVWGHDLETTLRRALLHEQEAQQHET